MKIYIRHVDQKLDVRSFCENISTDMRAQLMKVADELQASGTLKPRAGLDFTGGKEWTLKLRSDTNTTISILIGIEQSADELKQQEGQIFSGTPVRSRWLEIVRAPSEIEVKFNDREPYELTTWSVDDYETRLPAELKSLFRETVQKLLAGEMPSNVVSINDNELSLNLRGFTVRTVWMSGTRTRDI